MSRYLLLVDSRVEDIDGIRRSVLSNVDVMVFDYYRDTISNIKSRIFNKYDGICIAQHNYGTSHYRLCLNSQVAYLDDSEMRSWKEYADFLTWLKTNASVKHVDLLACDIWADENWRTVIGNLETMTGVDIRASANESGQGGDFIMESDNDVNLIGIYFSTEILNYKESFAYYVMYNGMAKSDSLNEPIDISLGGGTITAAQHADLFGTMKNCSAIGGSLKDMPDVINNVVNFTYTITQNTSYRPYAYAALTASGEVVTWGSNGGGADTTDVSSNISSGVRKIVPGARAFTAIKTDGTAYCWGFYSDGNPVNYTNSVNIPPNSISLTNIDKVVSCYNNSWAALTTDGKVLVWGKIANWPNLSAATSAMTSGCTKLVASATTFAAISGGKLVVWGPSGSYQPTTMTGLIDVYPLDLNAYVVVDGSGNVARFNSGTFQSIFTLNAGETIADCMGYIYTDALIRTSANRLCWYFSGSTTFYTGVTQFCRSYDDLPWAMIQNGALVYTYNDGTGFVTETSTTITNPIRVMQANIGEIGVLDASGNFSIRSTITTGQPTSYAHAGDGAVSVYGNMFCELIMFNFQGDSYIMKQPLSTNSTFNTATWPGTPTNGADILNSVMGVVHDNITTFNTTTSFLMVDISAQTVMSPSSIARGTSTNVSITTNVQRKMAIKNTTYKLLDNNGTVLSTFKPASDTYTYIFNDVTLPSNSTSLTIKDYDVSFNMFDYTPTITSGGGGGNTLQAPVITQLLSGTGCVYVYYTCATPNITKYQYSLNGGPYIDLSGIQMPFVITGLANTTRYNITLKAVSSTLGTTSASTSATAVVGAPQTPIITSVVPGYRKLTITFSYQSKNGTIIRVNGSFDGGATRTTLVSTDATTVVWAKLTNGIAYTPQIQVVNENGESEWSAPIGSFIPALVPTMLSITNAAMTGMGVATVSIAAPCDNGSPITKYQYSLNSDTTLYDISGMSSPFVISGLANNTSYQIRMYAVNAIGTSVASVPSNTIISNYKVPNEPTNLQSTLQRISLDVSGGALWYNGSALFDLSGQLVSASPPAKQTADMSVIYISDTSAVAFIAETTFVPGTTSSATPITNYKYNLGSGLSYTLCDMSSSPIKLFVGPNISYAISLKSVNVVGDSAVASVVANTVKSVLLVPTAPSITSCTPIGSGTVAVKITPSTARGCPVLRYAYTLDSGATYIDMVANPMVSNSYVATGLTNNMSRSIKVVAYSYLGYSALSAAKTFKIDYAVPDSPGLFNPSVSGQSMSLSFSSPASNGTAITNYTYTLTSGTNVITDSVSPTATQFTVTGLAAGKYTVTMKAVNALGSSAPSSAKTFTIR